MKVLVVEDHLPTREFLQILFKQEGYDVDIVTNGKEGFEAYKQYKPDLILSDIRMQHVDGLTLLRKIRAEKSDVFFIMTTAYGSEELAVDAFRNGANDYLIKPFDNNELLRRVRKYANIVNNRQAAHEVVGNEVYKFIRTQFTTDYNYVPMIVGKLVAQINANIDNDDKSKIEMGLNELITNSIEHGNLEITSDEKIKAYKFNRFKELCEERMKNKNFANRKVIVDYHQKKDVLVWKITDQGNGFNWEKVLDPTDGSRLLEPTGRGIFFSKYYFDTIQYIGKGNIVRVKKILK